MIQKYAILAKALEWIKMKFVQLAMERVSFKTEICIGLIPNNI